MPRPRFRRLAKDKREGILEAAAKEFSAHGYDGASLNKILDDAGISKGAAYYYFDDKADLYVTTVLHYTQELFAGLQYEPAQLTRENFWEEITALYRFQFTSYADRPWVFGVAKSGGPLSSAMLADGPLADLWQQAQGMMVRLLRHGQEVGAVRDDLPEELLLSWMVAVDDAHDRWLFAHWAELSPAELEEAAIRIGDALRRLLSPTIVAGTRIRTSR